MPHNPKPASQAASSAPRIRDWSLSWQIGAVVLGTVFLALASYIEVPMVPVPVTMQTFAVTLIGAVYGWRLGAATIIAWLVEGAIGLPVLSGGAAGAHHFVGPTAGYLFAFPVVGALTGWLAERGWNGNRPWLAFVSMLLGNALCLVLGAAWLSVAIGVEQAIVQGVTPFLVGGALKSALAAITLKLMTRAQK
ncbi:MAG: biotin transporter BioY [Mesorhizobium sp.]|uniref:biotin transporter BioY n=1 Tax=Mesorhizobium sp. TaxID=1871066 RepID=UPI000FE69414|nr:biotin transporter BioY [Mesorhizobium sp.]RWH84250.1 MAG: biotin transporter BioY [Mesorhizobium sp.]RWH86637.1 MAG: biotin transporter BioY [Mesorhizobium sp.]RWH93841.1 MAG: biotin transporter BioY [Mesorhizobium sp.]RWI02719.1 MAG: biotin transporter BioY [Mesorhizobium sp.]RWI05213.1 MAG: biotin transporter BioY [Mesorhizobium sp.]